MAEDTYTLLFSEILTKVNNGNNKTKKLNVLKQYDCEPLRMVLKSSFDPNIVWLLPEGDVPYKKNEAPVGTEHTSLRLEAKRLFNFIKGGNDKLPQFKREDMFIQMLEGLHESEAELLINAKDKRLHQVYKGLSDAVVKEAFGWNDKYIKS
jgi:hypothetical protein